MDEGYLGHSWKYLCKIINHSNWADFQGTTSKLYSKFKVSQYFDFKGSNNFSILNCYGAVKFFDFDIGTLKHPTFFKAAADIPDFEVELTKEQISIIEEYRKNRDVYITYNMKVLCSCDTENYFSLSQVYEFDMVLNAIIDKSKWIEEFLPQWDYFGSCEKIILFNNLNRFNGVKSNITNARRLFTSGEYGPVAMILYKALEALPIELNFRSIKDMFAFITKNDTDVKYNKINEIYKYIKEFMHVARHQRSEDEGIDVTREDAYLILNYTELMVDYLLEILKIDRNK